MTKLHAVFLQRPLVKNSKEEGDRIEMQNGNVCHMADGLGQSKVKKKIN